MKLIGLMMINQENDILPDVIAAHESIVDAFYVLDGTVPNDASRRHCEGSLKCDGYWTDAELPRPPYSEKPVDGYRQFLYEQAIVTHGYDNWFLLLHGDEIWRFNPLALIFDTHADGFVFQVPFYFPREGEKWDDTRSPLEQLHWRLGPGWPEFRMFKGGRGVAFDRDQHFNVRPRGLRNVAARPEQIDHYPYRAPATQRARAATHEATGFDPDNYRHVIDHDRVYWDDDMIAAYQTRPYFRELANV